MSTHYTQAKENLRLAGIAFPVDPFEANYHANIAQVHATLHLAAVIQGRQERTLPATESRPTPPPYQPRQEPQQEPRGECACGNLIKDPHKFDSCYRCKNQLGSRSGRSSTTCPACGKDKQRGFDTCADCKDVVIPDDKDILPMPPGGY